MVVADVLKKIQDHEVKFVDLRFTDTNGKEHHVTVSNVPGTTMGRIKVPLNVLTKFMKGYDYKAFDKKWIVDTPGFKTSAGQIIDHLTLEELKVSLPSKILKPTSFLLEEGESVVRF